MLSGYANMLWDLRIGEKTQARKWQLKSELTSKTILRSKGLENKE
jgi:hypothetical protein